MSDGRPRDRPIIHHPSAITHPQAVPFLPTKSITFGERNRQIGVSHATAPLATFADTATADATGGQPPKTFHEVKATTFYEVKATTFYEVKAFFATYNSNLS